MFKCVANPPYILDVPVVRPIILCARMYIGIVNTIHIKYTPSPLTHGCNNVAVGNGNYGTIYIYIDEAYINRGIVK